MLAIETIDLQKTYAAKGKNMPFMALKGVSLAVPKGSIFGLLGPNGAGKSTLINILAGLVRKSHGTAKVWGFDVATQSRQARAAIGVVPQELNLDAFFTPDALLNLQAGLYGVPKAERRTAELLEALGLTAQAKAYARSMSGGMRRRLMVAKALVHNPPVLVLDEPTAGVDVELRQQLWAYVRKLHERGTTIVLTTHYLEEAENLCDTIAIINHGQVVRCESKDKLLADLASKTLNFTLASAITELPQPLAALGFSQISATQLKVQYPPRQAHVGQYLAALQQAGVMVNDISSSETRLEDAFIRLTKKA